MVIKKGRSFWANFLLFFDDVDCLECHARKTLKYNRRKNINRARGGKRNAWILTWKIREKVCHQTDDEGGHTTDGGVPRARVHLITHGGWCRDGFLAHYAKPSCIKTARIVDEQHVDSLKAPFLRVWGRVQGRVEGCVHYARARARGCVRGSVKACASACVRA